MLTDQTFHAKPIVWVSPELFFDNAFRFLNFEVAATFAHDFVLHENYQFVLTALVSQAEKAGKAMSFLSDDTLLLFPDEPTPEYHKLWRFGCRKCFCIYSPSVADVYRHRSSVVLDASNPLEAYTKLRELL